MAWETAIILGVIGVTLVVTYIISLFEQEGIKVLLIMASSMLLIVAVSTIMRIACENSATTYHTDLNILVLGALIIVIVLFLNLLLYFLLTYTIALFNGLKKSKEMKKGIDWQVN